MERLTYKTRFGDYGSAKSFESEFAEKCALRNALGKYEDLGFLPDEIKDMIPKYPVGSIVYRIYRNQVFPLRVVGFQINHSGKRMCKLYINHNDEENHRSLWIDNWFDEDDENTFRTKEEAEGVIK